MCTGRVNWKVGRGHLWDELETKDNGNGQKSTMMIPANNPNNGGYMEHELAVSYNQARFPMKELGTNPVTKL